MVSVDLTGTRFSMLTVTGFSHKANTYFWNCMCDCGQTTTVSTGNLKHIKYPVRSCGCARYTRQPDAACKRLYTQYKTGAKTRSITFALSYDEAKELFTGDCHYCGSAPSNAIYGCTSIKTPGVKYAYYGEPYLYNGIDRVDNSIGYEGGNVVPCCTDCNLAKREMSAGDYIALCKRVVDRQASNYA